MGDSSPITTRQADVNRLNPGSTPLRLGAAVLDWAGTVADFDSFTPTQISVEAFAEFDVAIALDKARGPVGLDKWDHIHTLCNDGVAAMRFSLAHGRIPTDDGITAIYNHFTPLQIKKVGAHSVMIPGTLDTVAALYGADLEINTYSSYPRMVMDRVIDLAVKAGYTPDCVAAYDKVPRARPWPAQAPRCVVNLAIGDTAACVKVDDTVPGIEEDHRTGMWTVALLVSSNALGLSYGQYTALPADERARHRVAISAGSVAYHPRYKIDTIADLPKVVADTDHRLARGEHPQRI